MKTHAFTFVAGAASFAALAYAGGFHGSAWTFAGGFAAAPILAVAALGSRRRLRAAARALETLAGAFERPRKAQPTTRAPQAQQLDGTPAEVAKALKTMGATSKAAEAAARKAAETEPGAGFEQLFRVALPMVTHR
jgi:hypothetical protein